MAKLTATPSTKRPVLYHLNGDTSWLLQIPRLQREEASGRLYYNILIDPWFTGPQSQIAPWFHEQSHTVPSAVQTVAELETFLATTERLAGHEPSLLDAVIISLDGTDHAHPETLPQVHPDVPVFALELAAKVIRTWNHFKSVTTIPFWKSGVDWQAASVPVIAGRISVTSLLKSKLDLTNLHYGVLLTFDTQNGTGPSVQDESREIEAVAYIPHGIPAHDLAHVDLAQPRIRCLALIQAFHNVKVGFPSVGLQDDVVLGAHHALETARLLDAKYVVSTHDELKEERGVTAHFLSRKIMSISDAVNDEQHGNEVNSNKKSHGMEQVVLGSGENKVL